MTGRQPSGIHQVWGSTYSSARPTLAFAEGGCVLYLAVDRFLFCVFVRLFSFYLTAFSSHLSVVRERLWETWGVPAIDSSSSSSSSSPSSSPEPLLPSPPLLSQRGGGEKVFERQRNNGAEGSKGGGHDLGEEGESGQVHHSEMHAKKEGRGCRKEGGDAEEASEEQVDLQHLQQNVPLYAADGFERLELTTISQLQVYPLQCLLLPPPFRCL